MADSKNRERNSFLSTRYSDLFPQDFIISSRYFEKVSEVGKWDKLKSGNLVLAGPLFYEFEKIPQRDLDYFLLSNEILEEEKEHDFTEEVMLSKIAFLETKTKAL